MTTLRIVTFGLLLILEVACSSRGAIPPLGSADTSSRQLSGMSQDVSTVVATAPSLQSIGARDLGAAAAQTTLSVAVTLRYHDQADLDRLVETQTARGSAQYHHWLTNAQFNERFAPSQADYTKVVTALRAAGFHVDAPYENRTVVDARATVAAIEHFFRTKIHHVQGTHGAGYVNIDDAYAPGALSGILLSIDGLNTIPVAHTAYALTSPHSASATIKPAAAKSMLFGPVSAATNAQGYSPLAFWAGYDMPIEHSTKGKRYDGSGRISGIVIDADFAESDLRAYLSYFHITRTGPATKRILLHGGPPQGDAGGDSVEAALDSEALVGDAPGTALWIYEIPSLTNVNITDAFNTAVSDNKVDSMNVSFGGCEALVGSKTTLAWNAIAEQAAAKGITFHASTGDSGGSLCANIPASSPYVVAVGGTALTVGNGGAWAGETGWSGSSGSISQVLARPAWQAKVPGTVNRGRNLPDIAFDANPYTGFAFYYTASWNTQYDPIGGTSLASPIFGAAIAQIDQLENSRMGAGGPAIYGVFSANGYGSAKTPYFHDIVQGSNGPYYAGVGYDLVTGIGSVDVWNTAQKL